MNAKEKYNIIIETIEELAQGKVSDGEIITYDPMDISEKAFQMAGWPIDNRQKNAIFDFLMNKKCIDYIQERKMMAAYRYLIESDERTEDVIWTAATLAGVSDKNAFFKKFKKYFYVTPGNAFLNREKSLFIEMKDWEALTEDDKNGFMEFEEKNMTETKFGISKEQYKLAYVAGNLQDFYNLNEVESELAFELSQKKGLSLEDTFKYIYNYVWSYIDENTDERDTRLYEDLMNPKVLYMYFDCGMTFNEILMVLRILAKHELPREIKNADKKYLLGFWKYCKCFKNDDINSVFNNSYFCSYEELYAYYNRHRSEEKNVNIFLAFIDNATHMPLESALFFSMDIKRDTSYDEEGDLWIKEDDNTFLEYCLNSSYGEFDLSSFEKTFNQLDSEEETEKEIGKKTTRKLIGYKNLDIKQ